MSSNFWLPKWCIRFSFLPVKKLSITITLSPLPIRRSTRWLPTKPAPPVTSIRFPFLFNPCGTFPPTDSISTLLFAAAAAAASLVGSGTVRSADPDVSSSGRDGVVVEMGNVWKKRAASVNPERKHASLCSRNKYRKMAEGGRRRSWEAEEAILGRIE
ncbi:hypothetical protein LINGRAHAP2_LOCUS6315 [Linum grandiflorum]